VCTVFQDPARDVIWACSFPWLDSLKDPPDIIYGDTGWLLTRCKPSARSGIRGLKTSIESVESIRKRWVSGAFNISSFVISDTLNAGPHFLWVVGRKMALYLQSIISLSSFNASTQVSPCYSKRLRVAVPEC